MDALARLPSLGSEAFQVLMLVFRRSYGFQRKDAEMSISFIAKGTGLKTRSVNRTLKKLVSNRLLVRNGSLIKFNKNYDEWVVSKRLPSVQSATPPVSNRRREVVSDRLHNKEIINKHLKKEIPTATNVADSSSKSTRKKKDPNELIDLNEFLRQSRLSSRRDINIIADWAEANPPPCTTRGQWSVYIKRHLRAAQALAPFTEDQINAGFTKMRAAEYIDKPTLETLLKFIT